jgi:hypothetical protein
MLYYTFTLGTVSTTIQAECLEDAAKGILVPAHMCGLSITLLEPGTYTLVNNRAVVRALTVT